MYIYGDIVKIYHITTSGGRKEKLYFFSRPCKKLIQKIADCKEYTVDLIETKQQRYFIPDHLSEYVIPDYVIPDVKKDSMRLRKKTMLENCSKVSASS